MRSKLQLMGSLTLLMSFIKMENQLLNSRQLNILNNKNPDNKKTANAVFFLIITVPNQIFSSLATFLATKNEIIHLSFSKDKMLENNQD